MMPSKNTLTSMRCSSKPVHDILAFIDNIKKEDMTKFIAFIMLALYVLGTINGIAYSIYIGEYVTAIGVAVLSFMAFPSARYCWEELMK